jgi:hypothetical protein
MKTDTKFALYFLCCMFLSILSLTDQSELTDIGKFVLNILSVIVILAPVHLMEEIDKTCNSQS